MYVRMKKEMEILNLVTGLELLTIGAIYLFLGDISSSASWGIFGCMYLVMDKYSVFEKISLRRKVVDIGKYLFSWLGFFISSAFLVYLILSLY